MAGLNQLGSTVTSIAATIRSQVSGINSALGGIRPPNLSGFNTAAQGAAGAAAQVGTAAGGAAGGLNNMGGASGGAASGLGNVHNAARALISLELGEKLKEWGSELFHFADEATNAFNRVLATTKTQAQAVGVMDELTKVAIDTRQPLERVAETFQQVEVATNTLGVTYKRQIGLSKELNQLLVVSGASGQAAKAGISDLLRGLGAGKLSTQEIKGMARDIPALAQAITQGLGKGTGNALHTLVELNKQGKLTAKDVLGALEKVAPEIGAKFGKMIAPVSGGLESIKSAMLGVINDFNQFSGASSGVATVLRFIADHAGIFATALAGVAVVLVASVIPATVAWAAALLATPIGMISVAVAALGAVVGYFGQQSYQVAGMTASGWQVIKAVFLTAGDAIRAVFAMFSSGAETTKKANKEVEQSHSQVWQGIVNTIKWAANMWIASQVATTRVIMALWNNFPGFMNVIWTSVVNFAASAAEKLINIWQAPFRGLANLARGIAPELAAGIDGALGAMQVRLPRAQASQAGRQFGQVVGEGVRSAFNTDYVGRFGQKVVGHLRNIVGEAQKAKNAVDDIDNGGIGGEGHEGDEKKKKKKKGRAPQESDYDKEVRKLQNDTYDEGLTKEQLQLADALDQAGLPRNIEATGKLADNIKRLVKNLQEAHAVRQYKDQLDALKESYEKLSLSEEDQAKWDARKAAGLPTDLKVVNEKTKAIDAQVAANYRLKKAQEAAQENERKLTNLRADLDKSRADHGAKQEGFAYPNQSALARALAVVQKHRIEWQKTLDAMKQLDPLQRRMLQNEIDQATEDEKRDAVIQDRLDKTEALSGFLQDLWSNPREAMKRFFTDLLKNLLMAIAKATILKALMPGGGAGGGIGGAIKSALGSVFGGGKAVGGDVSSRKFYLVGENGPELFAPGRTGTIIPNHNLGGGGSSVSIGGTSITIMGNANDNTVQQMNRQLDDHRRYTLKLIDERLRKKGR